MELGCLFPASKPVISGLSDDTCEAKPISIGGRTYVPSDPEAGAAVRPIFALRALPHGVTLPLSLRLSMHESSTKSRFVARCDCDNRR